VNEIHTEVPYSKRCEFCVTGHSVATLHADNQVVPTFSVTVCAECLDKLTYGRTIQDVFGWSWSIDKVHRITAIMSPTRNPGWLPDEQPTPTQEARELVRDLVRALSQHLDPRLNPLSDDIRGRDEVLLFRAMNWLTQDNEKGVPDDDR
jgi:hypothetical protein